MKRILTNRRWAIIMFPLLVVISSVAFSQRINPPANKELPLRELSTMPGRLISEARTDRPSGELKLTGYRVEELRLPRTVNVEVRGQQIAADKAWRVTVTGGPFPVRALPAVIWIDDQIVGNGIENETLSQVTAITFDSSLIREGGVVSLSYGDSKEGRIKLSQKVQFKREGENQ
jgi:hypothetical protein